MTAPPMSTCAGMQQGRLQPRCRCPCCVVVGPLTQLMWRIAKRHCWWGTGSLPNPPKQSTPFSVLRKPVGFKVSIQHYSLALSGLWRCQEHPKIFIIWRLCCDLFLKLWKHCFSFPSLKLSRFLHTSCHLKMKLMHSFLPANALCIRFFKEGTYLSVHERSMCVKPVCAESHIG